MKLTAGIPMGDMGSGLIKVVKFCAQSAGASNHHPGSASARFYSVDPYLFPARGRWWMGWQAGNCPSDTWGERLGL